MLAYATDFSAGYLSVIDTTATPPAVTATIPLSLKTAATCTPSTTACKPTTTHPVGVTASTSGTTIYVDCSGPNGSPFSGAIDVVDVATDKVTKVIPLAHGAQASAINASGTTLYVGITFATTTTTTRRGAIDTVDLATDTVSGSVTLPTRETIQLITCSPSPEVAVVGDGGTRLGVIASKTSKSSTIRAVLDVYSLAATGTPSFVSAVPLTGAGFKAVGIAETPTDSTRVYVVARALSGAATGELVVVDLSTATKVTPPLVFTPTVLTSVNVAVSPGGTTVATTGTGNTTPSGLLVPLTAKTRASDKMDVRYFSPSRDTTPGGSRS